VKFNKEKVQLNKREVTYLGHIVSADGLKPDPRKVEAINDMPDPTDKQGIQRLLGTLNYLRGFIPNISQITEPLRALLKSDSEWHWGPEQEAAFAAIKRVLTAAPVLQYFDTSKKTTLQVDACKSGLGAVLLQDDHPVAYASRALSEAEQNYPQIDKELLAIVFGCEKFHSYVYGRPVDIQTDHNPLVSIVKKELYKASPRLQKLLLRLLKYDINRVSYVPGKYLYLADTLSRAYIGGESGEYEEDVVMVHAVQLHQQEQLTMSQAYSTDEPLRELVGTILSGWNWSHKSVAPEKLRPFWNYRDELHLRDGLIYRGERLLIPASLRKDYLRRIHEGHLGTEKCIERAAQSVFWPGISSDIRDMVAQCSLCQRFANHQPREPLAPQSVPSLPWEKLGMDIFEFKSKSFLIVVDFYSHFPEMRVLKQKRSEDVIAALKSIFAVHGIPTEIIADNMPFGSLDMSRFAQAWGFTITTSSPHYPRSNGMAERYVQTLKQLMRKSDSDGDLYAALLAYRQTPISGLAFSPAELLFSRHIRGPLPLTSTTLTPAVPEAYNDLVLRQAAQKDQHDKHAKPLRPLATGDPVLVRTNKESQWRPATVVETHQLPRSYIVDDGSSRLRRNRVHLKPNMTPATALPEVEEPGITIPSIPNNDDIMRLPQQPVTATPPGVTPRRSTRTNKGALPARFEDYDME